MARIVLGVTGGVAAYKACSLVRSLRELNHEVRVVPTAAALNFVGAATWEALSGQPVTFEVFADIPGVAHVALGQHADLVLVAPATADFLARAASGMASDLLGNVLLATQAPVLMFPAMHTEMWQHPATQANVATLRQRGVTVIDPAHGRLTGADSGPGRLVEPQEMTAVAKVVLARGTLPYDLVGTKVLVTAGGTREAIDPVRFLGNRSSGKQGYALAAAARDRGASVTLISANSSLTPPAGVTVVTVESAAQLHQQVTKLAASFDVVIMAAAVADYRPTAPHEAKVKKENGGLVAIELAENPDILADLVRQRGTATAPVLVGFAAETGDAQADFLSYGRAKLARKGVDALVVNDVSDGRAFEQEHNEVYVLTSDTQLDIPAADKRQISHSVWDVLGSLVHTA